MAKDYYSVLGVSRGADEKVIKSAYRKLARKYHPDVNPNDKAAESRFKEISEAWDVLGDQDKRKMYDQYGSNWEHAQNFQRPGGGAPEGANVEFQFGGGGFESIFEQFFSHMGGHEEPGRGRRQAVMWNWSWSCRSKRSMRAPGARSRTSRPTRANPAMVWGW